MQLAVAGSIHALYEQTFSQIKDIMLSAQIDNFTKYKLSNHNDLKQRMCAQVNILPNTPRKEHTEPSFLI